MEKKFISCDGNTAAANIAYAFSEVAIIYPITPSSVMGELADSWSVKGKKNLFGQTVKVVEMQSEAGAAGAIHGSLSAGAMTTTFTASQGLLLMLPNMFKIAGELLPTVFHVASRSLATQALSIFGDHSDTMTARSTGFALMAAGSVQEVQDLAVISHLSTLESSIPFLNFFDGFRTSHEIQKIESIDYEKIKEMIDMNYVRNFRNKALTPNKPFSKVGAQNPDVYFQGRESTNKFYFALPSIIKKNMNLFYEKTGRKYRPFDYVGAPDAEKIIISMGSSVETVDETINYLLGKGEKVGAIKVRLYRPFSVEDFISVLPNSVKKIAVLDRTKEQGSIGEPLYQDIVSALNQNKKNDIFVIGGRYGLSSKEFTPSMVNAIFNHLESCGHHGFTIGINDDVTNLSIPVIEKIDSEDRGVIRCKFFGYGSDGTVSANKNSIKIIGEGTEMYVQAYFQYDSKKSGGTTISHLRFGEKPIKSQYLLENSDFIALHKSSYIGKFDILEGIVEGGTFLINCPWDESDVFSAKEIGLGQRINTVMQAAFFHLAGVLKKEKSIEMMKKFIENQFARKGRPIIEMNWLAVDRAVDSIINVNIPKDSDFLSEINLLKNTDDKFTSNIIYPIMRMKGDTIPVSNMIIDGCVPTGTSKLEPRGVAEEVPCWIPENCIQCGQCSFVCPHAAIRMKQIEDTKLKSAPNNFSTLKSSTKNDKDLKFRVQVYPEYCIGCEVCIQACPTKNKALKMIPIDEARINGENEKQEFFDTLPNIMDGASPNTIKGSQFLPTYLEFSGACGGCGETAYIKLLTSLFGKKMIIANATGCSSIWGGTFPTIPYTKDENGLGPAWANSLFEDNAEYGYGMRIAADFNRAQLKENVKNLLSTGTTEGLRLALEKMLEVWDSGHAESSSASRSVLSQLPIALKEVYGESVYPLSRIEELKDYFVEKSVWIVGGDGWAYDIGFGGLDHVLASGKNINVFVLDTEVYSNTGGQASKSTPRGATAKFAMSGKETPKKNLGMMMMSYGNIYVAQVNLSANKQQVINAIIEAEKYDGPSLIIGYAPCINHGINMKNSSQHGSLAVNSGYWPLFRYNPNNTDKPMLTMDSPLEPSISFNDYILEETRYKALLNEFPDIANNLFVLAEIDSKNRQKIFRDMSEWKN